MLNVELAETSGDIRITFTPPPPPGVWRHAEFDQFSRCLGSVLAIDHGVHPVPGVFTVSYARLIEAFSDHLPEGTLRCHRELRDQLLREQPAPPSSGLQVNFHQHPFDTPERAWRFVLDQGRFIDYFFNRLAWHLAPTYRMVTPFPLHVDLESASTCNMNCPMCYRNMLESTGQMDFALYCKLIDECAAHDLYSVRLSWRGETLTHPRITEMIAYATARIPNVSFLTNAFYIDERIAQCLVEHQVSYVAVSFDGIGEVYETIRAPAKFSESLARLRMLRERRAAAGSLLPQIRTCTIWPAIRHAPEAYQRTMGEVADYMVKNPYINFKGRLVLKDGFVCQYPWERIVVGWDGTGQCCTGWNARDIALGDARTTTIHAMWHSPRQDAVRRMHQEGRRMELQSCRECRHGSQGDPDVTIEEIVERKW